jgi:glycosyltransferase involved in cell wall biosynthesis
MVMLKVLYIDGDGPFGGASRSLFEAIQALPKGTVAPYFLSSKGTAQSFYRKVALALVSVRAMSKFDNTLYGHYRGLRWIILLREVVNLPASVFGVLRARYRFGKVDLLHLNEITYIIPALFAKLVFNAPLVVHIRSLQNGASDSFRTRFLQYVVRTFAAATIAIDENVKATVPGLESAHVLHNSFSDSSPDHVDDDFRARLSELGTEKLRVGFVGNLHHSKGLLDLLEAARMLREQGSPVRFLIVGGTTARNDGIRSRILSLLGFEQNVGVSIQELVNEAGLSDTFLLLGPTKDIKGVYDSLDVLCFPSHYDAPGRPVFEAAFSSVPSIVAVSNPLPDTFSDGHTGIAVPMRDPAKIAAAIAYFVDHPDEVLRMGRNAKRLAELNFSPAKNSSKLLEIYHAAVSAERAEATVND